MSAEVLRGTGLHMSLGGAPVLTDVDLSIDRGEVVAVMGPSGSGKSTLLHVLSGLLRPDAGTVDLAGERLDRLGEAARARARLRLVGFVFQLGDLVPELTVRENVELPMRLLGARRVAARRRADEVLERLGVGDLATRRVSEVSGGQAQRVAVARAVAHRPAVVMADEPTGSLDQATGEIVMRELVACAHDDGTGVLVVTHDLAVASWASRDVHVRDGRLRRRTSHVA